MKKLACLMSATVLMLCMMAACDTRKPFRSAQGMVWNTLYHITYASNVELDDSVQAVMKRVEMSLSVFDDSSVVSRLNRCDTDMTDSMFRRVFIESQRVNAISGGAFDPTVGPLVDLWGFGRKGHDLPAPAQEEVDSALRRVGIADCRLMDDGRLIKKDSLTMMNFSAIAKGYGCDEIGRMMRRNGVEDYMVEIGGEIVVSGRSPRGGSWRIGIEAPVECNDSIVHSGQWAIEVDSCGIATSGNYRNYRVLEGRSMGHTIDPSTGFPVAREIVSATVIAPECITADALATASMVLPLDSAVAMIEGQKGVAAMFVTPGDSTEWNVTVTSRFPAIAK